MSLNAGLDEGEVLKFLVIKTYEVLVEEVRVSNLVKLFLVGLEVVNYDRFD